MASVRQRDGKYLVLYDVYEDGKCKQRSTGMLETPEEALEKAQAREATARPPPHA
jgi:hypothetical protein